MVGIYIIQNMQNNKVYIGQSWNIKERLTEHKRLLKLGKHTNRHLQGAWSTYGELSFYMGVLCNMDWIKNLDKDHAQKLLDDAEILWINYFGGENSNATYNIKAGGFGGTYSDEYRKWLSNNRVGKFAGVNNSMYGKHHSQETKQKISEHRKGKCVGVNNPNFGKHLSDEQKQKISQRNKLRIQTDDEKQKRNATMQHLRETKEFSDKMKVARQKGGLKNRKYSDEFVLMLREKHKEGRSIKSLSNEFDIPFESCRIMINGEQRFKEI